MNHILKFCYKIAIGLFAMLLQIIWLVFLLKSLKGSSVYFYPISLILSLIVVLLISHQKLIPETKQMWFILILFLPIFGILLYIISHSSTSFSRFKRRVKIEEDQVKEDKCNDNSDSLISKEKNPKITSQLNFFTNVGYPVYKNCEVHYYPYGKDVYPEMLDALKQAKHFILLEYFIISEGRMWEEILTILKEKATNGVEVKILYDDIGSAFHLKKDYCSELLKYQIQMISFSPKNFLWEPATDNRNHRKNLIIDGEVVFTGGINLADECIEETKKYGIWKDSSIKIRGAAVFEFTKMFAILWNANIKNNTGNINRIEIYKQYQRNSISYSNTGYIIPYGHNPFNQEYVASRVYLNIINQATKYLYVYTPYLILDYSMREAFLLAAKRGVEIKIITPGIPDKKLVYQVTRSYYKELLLSGIKIYEYTPGFLHAKCMISDDEVATVGAVNLDYRSLYTHFENGCYFYRGKIITTIKKDFCDTINSSREIQLSDIQTNFLKVCWETILNLFAPLL